MWPGEIRVQVRAHSYLNCHLPGDRAHRFWEIRVPPGAAVAQVCAAAALPRDDVALVTVNGQRAAWEAPVQAGDRVEFFPRVGGG